MPYIDVIYSSSPICGVRKSPTSKMYCRLPPNHFQKHHTYYYEGTYRREDFGYNQPYQFSLEGIPPHIYVIKAKRWVEELPVSKEKAEEKFQAVN